MGDNKKSEVPKDHEMFTSQGAQSATGVLRAVKGPNKKAAQDDPDYLRKMMSGQKQQGLQSDNKFEDAIYIYKNGYKIGDGPFMDANAKAENKKFLEELKQGVVPNALEPMLKEKFGANAKEMAVSIVDKKTEDYVPPKPQKPQFQAFKGDAHSMVSDQKEDMDASLESAKAEKIVFDGKSPNTRIQIILIGGKKGALKVNLTTTVLQLYGHVKAISAYDGSFSLMAGFPPVHLKDPKATVESEKLQGSRVQQKKL